jgi:hypothetical protein
MPASRNVCPRSDVVPDDAYPGWTSEVAITTTNQGPERLFDSDDEDGFLATLAAILLDLLILDSEAEHAGSGVEGWDIYSRPAD